MSNIIKLWVGIAITAVLTAATFATEQEAIPGEFIVKLKPGMNKRSMNSFANMFGANEVRPVTLNNEYLLVRRPMHELHSNALSTLANHPMVEYAEPNIIIKLNKTPNDPRFPETWGLYNEANKGVDISVVKAWDLTTGSRDVVVAVIDTGVDYTHPDIAPNAWVNQAELNGVAGKDDDGNGYVDDIYGYDFANNDADPKDDHGHGTHCAGTIGANGDDGVGVAGVNWQVSIMGIKFLTAQGSGSLEGAVKSIDYATANKVDIMSNSWGGGGKMQSLEDAITRAKDAGILFVAAAGNDGSNNDSRPTYPAGYEVDNVLSVAAIGTTGALASFSNFGKDTVDIAAPGVDVMSTIINNGYKKYSGTSMATPHVSGVAALLKAYDPSLNYAQLKERLITTTKPLAALRGKTASGLVSAYNALMNETGGIDPEDPANWSKVAYNLSTPHPYSDAFTETYEVKLPGAKKLAVFFADFSTEYRFDVVTFKDANGKVLGTMSGDNKGAWSPSADGDTLIIEFVSDGSINGYGFDISQIGYLPAETQPPTEREPGEEDQEEQNPIQE